MVKSIIAFLKANVGNYSLNKWLVRLLCTEIKGNKLRDDDNSLEGAMQKRNHTINAHAAKGI